MFGINELEVTDTVQLNEATIIGWETYFIDLYIENTVTAIDNNCQQSKHIPEANLIVTEENIRQTIVKLKKYKIGRPRLNTIVNVGIWRSRTIQGTQEIIWNCCKKKVTTSNDIQTVKE